MQEQPGAWSWRREERGYRIEKSTVMIYQNKTASTLIANHKWPIELGHLQLGNMQGQLLSTPSIKHITHTHTGYWRKGSLACRTLQQRAVDDVLRHQLAPKVYFSISVERRRVAERDQRHARLVPSSTTAALFLRLFPGIVLVCRFSPKQLAIRHLVFSPK